MTKILSLDVGEKRIGLAMSDEMAIIASPYKTIGREDADKTLESIVKAKKIDSLVVGLPYLANGELGSQALDIQEFAKELGKKIKLPIEFENEILTSNEAENRYKKYGKKIKNKGEIDLMAATIILESYLERRKN